MRVMDWLEYILIVKSNTSKPAEYFLNCTWYSPRVRFFRMYPKPSRLVKY